MANHHLNARTTIGAADAILDWFATFEAWITGTVGWTVVAGSGTDNMFLSSPGEAGGYTMLFIHVWRVPATDTVRMEVCDDAIPTHTTNEGGTLNSLGAADFYFYMSANLECIVIAWKYGGVWRFIYAGAIMPYGTNPVDETYYMVATSDLGHCSILRNSAGLWDRDLNNYENAQSDNVTGDLYCDNFPIFGLYADRQNLTAGQYWFISGLIGANTNVTQGDILNTCKAGYNSSWIVLMDHNNEKFALWTGGTWPPGYPPVGVAYVSSGGVSMSGPLLADDIADVAVMAGWTDHGGNPLFPRADPGDWNHVIESPGLTQGPLWITVSWDQSLTRLEFFVHNNSGYTHYTYSGAVIPVVPTLYKAIADMDCLCAAIANQVLVQYPGLWAGRLAMPPCDLTDVNMSVAAAVLDQATQDAYLLRGRDGTWSPGGNLDYDDTNTRTNTNANAYDATTYFVHPCFVRNGLYEYSGITKFMNYTNGGGIVQNDNIGVDGVRWHEVYKYNNTPRYWAMRI